MPLRALSLCLQALGAACLASSCSILEDRSDCPCQLTLDLSDPVNASCDSLLVDVWSANGFSCSALVPRDSYDEAYTIRVLSRIGAQVSVIDASAAGMYTCGGGGMRIPHGEQCPNAYMYNSSVETSGETSLEKVTVRKNYCGVSMSFVSADLQKYVVKIQGNVCGYSSEGRPVAGDFVYSPLADRPDVCFFRLPRQTDSSLKLSISVPGGKEKTFALGSYIAASGYDWTKNNLDDIVICIDYASMEVKISINGWSTVVEEDIVI